MIVSTKEAAQKRKELEWFDSFQQKRCESPLSNPEQPPPPNPDLVFVEEGLGIEVTQYLLGQGENGSHACRLENVRGAILPMAQSLYEVNFHDCIQVSVRWANDLCPENGEYDELARAISQAVATREDIDGYWCIESESLTEPLLQKYIDGISAIPIPGGGASCWANSTGICFGTVDYMIQSFQKLLDEKAVHIVGYRSRCERVWLLIVADRRRFSASISSHVALSQATFRSKFDRVFVLDEHCDKVLELRLTRRQELKPSL